jgi:hypothetical protein
MTNNWKNPHAVALGRLARGVPKRFSTTSAERSEAARRAILARWDRRPATDLWEQQSTN